MVLVALLCMLSLLALSEATWPSSPDGEVVPVPPTFDCSMRWLAYEYGQKLAPWQGSFGSLYYALGLNIECQNDTFVLEEPAEPQAPFFEIPTGDANTFYVDYASGSDSNPGTLDFPLKTLLKAITTARGVAGPNSIVMRNGTHFIAETIQFTPEDNDLTIQNYPGETPILNAGIAVNTTWQRYGNYTPPPPPGSFYVYASENAVYGTVPTPGEIVFVPNVANVSACQAICEQYSNCTVFTWHDQNQGEYAFDCVIRFDGVWELTAESGHYSGCMVGKIANCGPGGLNPWVADISGQGIKDVLGMQVNGLRAFRARFPNCNPYTTIPDIRISGSSVTWLPPLDFPTPTYITNTEYLRNTSYEFQNYMVGIGGTCSIYDPPISYWCSEYVSGGGASQFTLPSGFIIDSQQYLPNAPYQDTSKMIANVYHPDLWENWMFEMAGTEDSELFAFGYGGFQGGRGAETGGNFFVEDIFEEWDYEGEYFYNTTTGLLYFNYNDTGIPPPQVVVTNLKVMFNMTSSRWNPIRNITLKGLQFTATAYTYMDAHGVISGGDWALDRFGAVFLQGTELITVQNCYFQQLDGNALFLSGYNRNTTVLENEFAWIGANAIASWGFTNDSTLQGVDGTDGNQPRFNQIIGNVAREIGHYEKQSSFYVQGKSCQNTIVGNVFFNAPRAGINFIDGFGGGNEVAENLVFSTCRETGDHGPFNSWDRQPFLTEVRNGTPSLIMQWNEIHHNFFVDNYNPQEDVDNDDGSCYYHTHDNFLVYGAQGMKNDFGGHDNYHYNNMYAYVSTAIMLYCTQYNGHEDYFYNNSVVMYQDGSVGAINCSPPGMTVLANNTIYSPTASITECGVSLAQWQAEGHDPGTTVHDLPSDELILNWARVTLGLN